MTIYVVTTKSRDYSFDDVHFSFESSQNALRKAVEIASNSNDSLTKSKLDSIYEINLDTKKVVEQELELKNGQFELKKKAVKK